MKTQKQLKQCTNNFPCYLCGICNDDKEINNNDTSTKERVSKPAKSTKRKKRY